MSIAQWILIVILLLVVVALGAFYAGFRYGKKVMVQEKGPDE